MCVTQSIMVRVSVLHLWEIAFAIHRPHEMYNDDGSEEREGIGASSGGGAVTYVCVSVEKKRFFPRHFITTSSRPGSKMGRDEEFHAAMRGSEMSTHTTSISGHFSAIIACVVVFIVQRGGQSVLSWRGTHIHRILCRRHGQRACAQTHEHRRPRRVRERHQVTPRSDPPVSVSLTPHNHQQTARRRCAPLWVHRHSRRQCSRWR